PQEYWRQIDVSIVHQRGLPLHPGGVATTSPGDGTLVAAPEMLPVALSAALQAQLLALADRLGASVESVLLTCWSLVLWRLMEQDTVLLGAQGDGRVYEELGEALGPYSRLIPLAV